MARTREARVLLEDEEYERLETLASQRGVSMSDLIREAVRDRFMHPAEQRMPAVEAIRRISVSLPEWSVLELEIAEAQGSDQFTTGTGNYTEERREVFAEMTFEDIVSEIKGRRPKSL